MVTICKGCDRSGPRSYVVLERPTARDAEGLEAAYDARELLSAAQDEALTRAIEDARKFNGSAYAALELWRMVANARDHVHRAVRRVSGLEERSDPYLPEIR